VLMLTSTGCPANNRAGGWRKLKHDR